MYEIETEDFYKDISQMLKPNSTRVITQTYPSGIESGCNKKVTGLFKEVREQQILEFVGLRPKLYSFRMKEKVENKKCKGTKKVVIEIKINIQDYKRKMNVIRSHKHDAYTEEVNKIALSANDDKRVKLEDGVHTKAHGYRNGSSLSFDGSLVQNDISTTIASEYNNAFRKENTKSSQVRKKITIAVA